MGLAQFLVFIDQFTEEQLMVPKDAAGWNGRDHITHLAAWLKGIVALLNHQDRWAAVGVTIDDPRCRRTRF